MKVEKKAYGTKGLIETHLASKSSPPTIDNSMDHVTRFVSRYSLIYDLIYNGGPGEVGLVTFASVYVRGTPPIRLQFE